MVGGWGLHSACLSHSHERENTRACMQLAGSLTFEGSWVWAYIGGLFWVKARARAFTE